MGAHPHAHASALDGEDLGLEFPAMAVEQRERRTDPQSQYPGNMRRRAGWQRERRGGGERRGHEAAHQAHERSLGSWEAVIMGSFWHHAAL